MLGPLGVWSVLHMLLAAAVAGAASWVLRRRTVSEEARPAAVALRVFWAGLGGTALVQTGMMLGAAAGVGATFALVSELLAYGTSAVALGSLAAYFAFLFTGSRRAILVVGALYVVVIAFGSLNTVQSAPTGIALTRWFYEVNRAYDPGGFLAAAPALAALLPAIVGSIGFIVLGLRSRGATRQRGVLVGTALVFWFGSALAVSTGTVENDAAQVARKLASMAGFGSVFLAYFPPRFLQDRWGLVGLGEEDAYTWRQAARAQTKRQRGQALDERVRELV